MSDLLKDFMKSLVIILNSRELRILHLESKSNAFAIMMAFIRKQNINKTWLLLKHKPLLSKKKKS